MSDQDFLFLHLRDLPYFRALIRAVEATFYQTLDLPAPTLDVGCGDGHFASLTFDRPIEIGLDPWHAPMREARQRRVYRLLVEADAAAVPFPAETFASAFSNSVLEHIPHIDAVLSDLARVLKPGAPFYFCVPNERYLSELSLSRLFGRSYTEWFRRISRVEHADGPEVWQRRLERAGFRLERWWHYFSPAAMRVLEWGHYFGLPSLVAKKLTGRWILAPAKWNLWLTEQFVRRYASSEPVEDGTFTFYVAKKLTP
ncbi:MAG: class I SAM-dependent methyltransferase [Anaerolineales bacterium]|nr:class I SAM-dependent methyltransferase [Anaerolineales bacterium]MCX7609304.1 class I SAM-dependent methyltransferase [Anaerolineales bacterium]